MKITFAQHLKSANDLITPYSATRAGFISQALEKNRRATPFVQQARDLRSVAQTAMSANELLDMENIQASLLTAAGVSDKAEKHLHAEDRRSAISNLIENFLLPAGDAFVEELVYRFLLTRGDSLGGALRNSTGAIAQQRFSAAILARFRNQGNKFQWRAVNNKTWSDNPNDDAAAALVLNGIHWSTKNGPRTLIYNHKVAHVGKNIDLCLLCIQPDNLDVKNFAVPQNYLALGELKGGIDPAGADEHWKTARTAFVRINKGFQDCEHPVHTFFIGAAIVESMAKEIWEMLQGKSLENAANLTNDNQLSSIVSWLTKL